MMIAMVVIVFRFQVPQVSFHLMHVFVIDGPVIILTSGNRSEGDRMDLMQTGSITFCQRRCLPASPSTDRQQTCYQD